MGKRDPRSQFAVQQSSEQLKTARHVKLPPRSHLNAYAKRFVRTIKESCLERFYQAVAPSPPDHLLNLNPTRKMARQ
jgi:hypothetical protein